MARRPQNLDWPLFLLGLLLSISGLVLIYSATWQPGDDGGGWYFSGLVIRQAIYLTLAVAAFLLFRHVTWGLKPDAWWWFYTPAMLLLGLVLLIGTNRFGAQRWITLGPVDLQPSELAKLAFILILAWLYSTPERSRLVHNFYIGLAVMCSMMLLVLLQPDLGTSMAFVFIFFVMSAFAVVPKKHLTVVLLYIVLIALLGWHFALHEYQRDRIRAFMYPDYDPLGKGYHIEQSQIAVGSGGFWGKGFLRGTQVREDFLPVVESDFIFAVVAEEFGFVGCFWLILLYFLLQARILALARQAKSSYERYICYGTSAVIFFHVFVAAGMTMRLAPVTGLPLPFVSYGGSALLTMWLLLAIIQSIFANSQRDFTGPRVRRQRR